MLNETSTTAITRTLLLAGILLAVTVLAARSFFPAFADEDGTDHIHYDEHDTDQVAAFSATDQDGDDLKWSLATTSADAARDHDDFDISPQGVLTFSEPPNFEDPDDIEEDNTYMVTVQVTDGEMENGATRYSTREVIVKVTNVNEPGTIELSSLQPKEGTPFTVTLFTDPDEQHGTSVTDTALLNDETNVKWQWARCSTTDIATCEDIEESSTSTSYTAVEDDRGQYLRVVATYADGHTPTVEGDEELQLNKTASAMSANPVVRIDYVPEPPLFPGQEDATGGDPQMRTTQATTSRDITENSPAGTPVGAPIVAMDEGADGNQEVLTYTFVPGNDASSYEIDGSSGQIRVGANANLNIERPPTPDTIPGQPAANPEDVVVVRATDPTDRYANVEVTINVTNVDESPIITTGLPTYTPNENSHEDSPTLTLGNEYTAWDPEDDTIEWSVSGTDRARFAISQSGQLSFKEAPNYEAPTDSGRNNSYEIAVVASDSEGNTGSRTVTVNVLPVPEPGSIALSNRGARVGTALTATLTDDDGVIGRVTWTWSGNGTPTEVMGGNSNTFTPHAGYDGGTLTIIASYKDGGPGDTLQNTSPDPPPNGVVQTNATPTTPVFQNSDNDTIRSAEVTIEENNQPGDQLITRDAYNVDATDTVLTYSISGGDASAFEIDDDDGDLRVKSALDRESKSSYRFNVSVKNRANRSASLSLTVTVTDDDESPVFTAGATSTDYAEGSRGSHRVDTYTARDPEGENVTLELLPGADAADFNFERGILSFKNAPDFESGEGSGRFREMYTVTIRASDGSTANVDLPVVVTVTNVEEPGEVTLDALAPKNDVELTASLTDPDDTIANQNWIWSNSSSRTGPWATSTGSMATTTAGESTADYAPDLNDVGKYLRALVTYTDGESVADTPTATKTASMVSTHVVRDVDYANTAPIFPGQEEDNTPAETSRLGTSNATTSRQIAENSPAGTRVGAPVAAVDRDESHQQQVLTYSKFEGDTNAHWALFDLARGTGQITVKQGTMLNYDVQTPAERTYTVTVMAKDPSELTSMSVVTIMVTNVKEPPKIDPATTTPDMANLAEIKTLESTATTSLTSYTVTDDEDNPNLLKWSLSGADEDMFVLCIIGSVADACDNVNAFNSNISTVHLRLKPTDYEQPADSGRNNVYNVTVTATDSDMMTVSRNVVVTVTNMEESGTVTLSNQQPEVGTPITATLTDPDGGITGLIWQWYFGAPANQNDQNNLIRGATSATYTPVASEVDTETDVNRYLRAVATYTDGAPNPDDVDETLDDESKDTAERRSAQVVQVKPDTNATPQFADEDPDVTGKQTERFINESAKRWQWSKRRRGGRLHQRTC